MSENVTLRIDDNIATVTLNRPHKKNALTLDMLQTIADIGESLKSKKTLRCIIIKGSSGTFSSGIDVMNFSTLSTDKNLLKSIMEPLKKKPYNKLQKPSMIWNEISVPVIAVLEGPVFGAGLQLALGADIRIASPNSLISIMETKWGLIPDMGISQHLPRLINYDQALLLTLTSEFIDAAEAKNLGLVTCCSENPYSTSLNLAATLSTKSPDAIKYSKFLYNNAWKERSQKTLKLEATLQTKLIGSPNQMEAVLANMEKRTPKFDRVGKLNGKK